ncbi:ABC transporter permease subunit [Methanobrevibacter sp. OttesenSCG-928-K11]|nr:ABC transporter permease subunit [Methanobrevibacter sp. OttesenSCG-928-K11]MDL2271274.1 ABC transporter permease subunit [Methanobrevibacter sp. OttesenSCG-928-I08]
MSEQKDFFINLTLEHLQISLIAIVFAIIVGLILGIIVSEYQRNKWILSIINFVYTIPSIALFGFLIPFTGIGDISAIIALIVYALLPMVRGTHSGIVNIDKNIIEAAKGMGSTKFQILYKIKLPLALPHIMSSIRTMVVMTIALTGIAAFIGAGGLGVAIYRGITTNNIVMTLAGSILIAALAIIVDFLLSQIEKLTKYDEPHRRFLHKYNLINKKTVIGVLLIIICILAANQFLTTSEENTINIATKPMTEQYIIGAMLEELIESESDLNVDLTTGVGGGTSNIQPGMLKGDFDLYPEYTGTGWMEVLKEDGIYNESLFNDLQSKYNDEYDFSWVGMYGFDDTYGIAVTKEVADKYNLSTYSDLASVSNELKFGAEYDFYEREDGYDALCEEYGFNFKSTTDLDIGLKYNAIKENKIDVMNVFTTDGQLNDPNIVVLKDDKEFYPSYLCANVVRNEVLEEHPELKNILLKLEGAISAEDMSRMNYEVEIEKKEPKDVAHEFLVLKGLV